MLSVMNCYLSMSSVRSLTHDLFPPDTPATSAAFAAAANHRRRSAAHQLPPRSLCRDAASPVPYSSGDLYGPRCVTVRQISLNSASSGAALERWPFGAARQRWALFVWNRKMASGFGCVQGNCGGDWFRPERVQMTDGESAVRENASHSRESCRCSGCSCPVKTRETGNEAASDKKWWANSRIRDN